MGKDEHIENRRKKLIFRSGHRGTKEMDLIMGSFAQKYVPGFSEMELALYEDILQISDPDLYDWITGKQKVPANVMNSVLEKLLAHRVV
ncbi:MAG TPA: succinate dehydrogenase assembly factor 2 [Rhodospirillaceae bacterium]|nr:succinate dehydrogenase assembly factor 2 [Rhodospirillaceae bacterium]